MNKAVFRSSSRGDTTRDPGSFPAFTPISNIQEDRLEQYIAAIHIEAISAIEWRWKEGWSVGPRIINDSMWFWFQRGRGKAWVGDPKQTFHYRDGDMILIPQGQEHYVAQEGDAHAQPIAVHFHGHILGAINVLSMFSLPPLIEAKCPVDFGGASKRLAREFALKQPGWRIIMNADIAAVLLSLLRIERTNPANSHYSASHSELVRFLPVFEQLDRHLGDPGYTVAEMSKVVFLSEVQFRKLFLRITGTNPIRFLQRRRIERASVLLRTTDESIHAIAEACGFMDLSFFHRIFKKWAKMTPGQYRQGKRL